MSLLAAECSTASISELDEVLVKSWRPIALLDFGKWSAGSSGGVTTRANSVFPVDQILEQSPALYLSTLGEKGIAAVSRLSIDDQSVGGGWAGIACFAVRDDVRNRGWGRRLMSTILECATDFAIERLWLQVDTPNVAAQSLYANYGFQTAWQFHFRQRDVGSARDANVTEKRQERQWQ